MYIVAIAWLYVVLMVSITQPSVLKGILTFLGTGLLPLALFLWLVGTPQRRRSRLAAERPVVDDSTQPSGTGGAEDRAGTETPSGARPASGRSVSVDPDH